MRRWEVGVVGSAFLVVLISSWIGAVSAEEQRSRKSFSGHRECFKKIANGTFKNPSYESSVDDVFAIHFRSHVDMRTDVIPSETGQPWIYFRTADTAYLIEAPGETGTFKVFLAGRKKPVYLRVNDARERFEIVHLSEEEASSAQIIDLAKKSKAKIRLDAETSKYYLAVMAQKIYGLQEHWRARYADETPDFDVDRAMADLQFCVKESGYYDSMGLKEASVFLAAVDLAKKFLKSQRRIPAEANPKTTERALAKEVPGSEESKPLRPQARLRPSRAADGR